MKKIVFCVIFFGLLLSAQITIAGAPAGNFWFQFFTQTQTGADSSGDGGTGVASDLNYYYVGQSINFSGDVNIDATQPSNGADLIVGYDKNILSASALTSLSAYQNWVGLSVDNGMGKFTLSGYNNPGTYYTGQRSFANITMSMSRPSSFNYGPTSTVLNINYVAGQTTESNIARNGADFMDSKEDFNMIVWADTKKPFGLSPLPTNGAAMVAVENNYTFIVHDSKNGEGDNSGVGTGFTAPPTGRNIDIFNGSSTSSYTGVTANALSGIFQTVCNATVDPASPLAIAGDNRNWDYDTNYTVEVGGYTDRASATQNQLGDANGPNVMDDKIWAFTTEPDTIPPSAQAINPIAGQSNVGVATNITIDLLDKKSANVSGVGVSSSTCKFTVSSPSWGGPTVYTFSSAQLNFSAIPYGFRYVINPASDFAQNELVTVNVSECKDLVDNMMDPYIYTFFTTDADPPYVATTTPIGDQTAATSTDVMIVLKDDGVGVNLGSTVIYINGVYYTNSGGGGSVSSLGVNMSSKIFFTTSTDFNPFMAATTSGYIFTIPGDYNAGEAVDVVVYSKDTSNNIMVNYSFSFVTEGGSCTLGSTYCGIGSIWDNLLLKCTANVGSIFCGSNSSWNGSLCIGSGGGGGGGGGSSAPTALSINETNESVIQIDASSILVSWYSSIAGTSRVVYGLSSVPVLGLSPNYGYDHSNTEVDNKSAYHAVRIDGLTAGKLYYFRPVTMAGNVEVVGKELLMAPKFATAVVKTVCEKVSVVKPATVIKTTSAPKPKARTLNILDISSANKNLNMSGTAKPKVKLKVLIY